MATPFLSVSTISSPTNSLGHFDSCFALKPPSWSGLADYGQTVRDCYRKDLWAQMPKHVEKDVIADTIHPVTNAHDVALWIIRSDVR
jgi:hypothetical protein